MTRAGRSSIHDQEAAPSQPTRVLLVRADRLGDPLTSTPVIRALRQTDPQARIDLLASDRNEKAVQGNPHMDSLWVLPLKGCGRWPMLAARLRWQRYGWAVDRNPGY